ncbi:MAG TPA: class I SAM-dependent methyltransferase [Thermoanaerobaculia bacterium]|nr:class I SAM-dependent methyltransferase [Thermoanaerobaculia bacterium]
MLHPLIEEIQRTKRTQLADGSEVAANSFIPRDECELIYEVIAQSGATRGVETGMAYGISSLCIADALRKNSATSRLVSIDPSQTDGWHGAAIHLLLRAGFTPEVIEEPSQLALPRLVREGQRFDFGFIDGWHTFDHTLIDFFYIDMLLENGGFIVLDDVGYPAINAAVRFILANRDYELVKALTYEIRAPMAVRRAIKRMLRPLARTDRDPSPQHELLFRRVERAHAIAIRKRGADTRRFDHYERF